jgi:hypothetical protein
VLVIEETGDRKWGTKTAHVGRQYLGSIGKIDNGVVSVSSLWAEAKVYYPLEVEPYTPAHWFTKGKGAPALRTKPMIALALVAQARAQHLPFRAVVADAFYGSHIGFWASLLTRGVGYVLAEKPSHAWWHAEGEVGSASELAQAVPWHAEQPGRWQLLLRQFRDGHTEQWWVLEAEGGPSGRTKVERLVIASTDPATLPDATMWYLVTNLPAPSMPSQSLHAPATVADVVRLYGLRVWVEQSYKQVKQTLGWAQSQVRADLAIRRHWHLVYCAFAFCWWAEAHTAAPVWELSGAAAPSAPEEPSREDQPNRFCQGQKKKTVAPLPRPTQAREAGQWPYATSGRGWNRASCCGATGGRGPPSPRPQRCNDCWTGSGRGEVLSSISGSNKLLLNASKRNLRYTQDVVYDIYPLRKVLWPNL